MYYVCIFTKSQCSSSEAKLNNCSTADQIQGIMRLRFDRAFTSLKTRCDRVRVSFWPRSHLVLHAFMPRFTCIYAPCRPRIYSNAHTCILSLTSQLILLASQWRTLYLDTPIHTRACATLLHWHHVNTCTCTCTWHYILATPIAILRSRYSTISKKLRAVFSLAGTCTCTCTFVSCECSYTLQYISRKCA